ncbi:MAG: N-acetylmuramoyl-L-alanine amidase [Acidimicrobiia bacterium]
MAGYGLEVIPREGWAENRPQLEDPGAEEVRFLLVHHSATSNSYGDDEVPAILRGFYDLHTGPERGWGDIAYNFLIDRFGRIWEGRDGSVEGAVMADATGGNQGFSQLACLAGDFTTEMPTPDALASLTRLLGWMADRYRIDTAPEAMVVFISRGSNRWEAGVEVETPTIAGHRDMSITSCPGDAFYPYVVDGLAAEVEAFRQELRDAQSAVPLETTTTSAAIQPPTTAAAITTTSTSIAATTATSPPPAVATQRNVSYWVQGLLATGFLSLLWVLRRRLSGR